MPSFSAMHERVTGELSRAVSPTSEARDNARVSSTASVVSECRRRERIREVLGSQYGFPFVHIECDFKVPSRMGDIINLTLLVERIGRSSLGIAIVCHQNGIERLCARIVTAMMSLEARKAVPLPEGLRTAVESYRQRTRDDSS